VDVLQLDEGRKGKTSAGSARSPTWFARIRSAVRRHRDLARGKGEGEGKKKEGKFSGAGALTPGHNWDQDL